jgi:tRNA pseudouridine13 synthase
MSDPRALRAAALAPPQAHGAPPAAGLLRAEPEDFLVEEELGFAPAGSGAHLLLQVRKRNANTQWVARELARAAGCRPGDVGFAGLKDRRSVAVQWFSVPQPRSAVSWQGLRGEGFEVLEAHAHTRKLPRGALAANRFSVRVRALDSDGAALAAQLAPRLRTLAALGVPNYFGAQRFGRDAANLSHGAPGLARLHPAERGFALSASRSVIFNALLARRVREGNWNQLLEGDIANLDGRGSIFAADLTDATLAARCARLEIHPTGPLWGAGHPATRARVLELESQLAQDFATECALCAAAGMRHERRSLRLRIVAPELSAEAQAVVVRFQLPRGCFATAVLRELVAASTSSEMPD